LCAVADDHQGFLAAVERALVENSLELRQQRSRSMESETWQARVAEIERMVSDIAARKRGRT
jgi:hypothetical protein